MRAGGDAAICWLALPARARKCKRGRAAGDAPAGCGVAALYCGVNTMVSTATGVKLHEASTSLVV